MAKKFSSKNFLYENFRLYTVFSNQDNQALSVTAALDYGVIADCFPI
jgi:hypothetical protein